MKVDGVLAMLLLSFLSVSCSMDDTLPQGGGTDIEHDVFVPVCITAGAQTKSVEDTGVDDVTEMNISSRVVFLLNKENDSYNVEDVFVSKETTTADDPAISFFTKNGTNKYLYAVTNVSDNTIDKLKECATLSAIQAVPLTADDLPLYPKASGTPEKIDFGSFVDKGDGVLRPTTPLSLPVSQRTARIELQKLTYSVVAGTVDPQRVTLKSITLKDRHVAGLVKGESSDGWGNLVWNKSVTPSESGFDVKDVLFNTYENTGKETVLEFVFEVEGQLSTTERTASCLIKTPVKGGQPEAKIYAGNIHKLILNAEVSTHEVKISLTGTVQDWITGDAIDLGDINANI